MNPSIDKWIDDHKDELIASLQKCIAFNTERNDATKAPGAPFGKIIGECLESTLKDAESLGFTTKNYDGYCGAIDFGTGAEQLGILAHLDVVPAGGAWTYPPFAGEIHDGFLYGRGTLDDKGPAIAAMYALAAVKASGLDMKRRVRIILGCDEESGMGCLEHYNEVETAPTLSFSPDASYPLVNSEKLIYRMELKKEYASKIKLDAGTVRNAVPGEAVAEIPLSLNRILPIMEAFMEKSEFPCSAEATEYGAKIRVTGVASHASNPEDGRNAFLAMLQLLDKLPLEGEDAKTVAALADILKFDCHGESLLLDSEDQSGRLTLCVGVVNWDETGIKRLTVDIRAPITSKGDAITEKLIAGFAKPGLTEINHGWSEGYYIPEDHELVKNLLDVYEERFGVRAKPLAIGGGTYARHLKNAVAFGPERPGEPACIHMANERVSVDHLIEDTKIIADAIVRLACK